TTHASRSPPCLPARPGAPLRAMVCSSPRPDDWRWAPGCTRCLHGHPLGARRAALLRTLCAQHLSLSPLNHGQPGVQAHPEIVQGTAELHHEIADALLPQADPVFHNPTTLDATVDMLDPEPPLMEYLVGQVLLQGQLPTAGLLRRHEDLHLG